jgi:hypothetical protein
VGEASNENRCSPSEYSDRLELRAPRLRDGLLPSCSQRALQSLSGARGITVSVSDPPLVLASEETDLRGLPACPRQAGTRRSCLDPLMDFVLLQGMTRTGPPLARPPLMGSVAPTAHQVTGSDQHRAYHTRLCHAFGFSQPLDVLLLPKPLRPCFMPVALMGFALQRLSLLASRQRLSALPAPPDVFVGESFAAWRARPTRRSGTRPSGEALGPSPLRDLQLPAVPLASEEASRAPRSAADGSDAPSGVRT